MAKVKENKEDAERLSREVEALHTLGYTLTAPYIQDMRGHMIQGRHKIPSVLQIAGWSAPSTEHLLQRSKSKWQRALRHVTV